VNAASVSSPSHNHPKVFFSSTVWTTFIERDEIVLSRHYPLERIIASGIRALARIPGAVARSDVTLSWFGSVYAGYTVLLSKILRKKSIIIVGGVDASKDREINYGIWLNPWKSVVVGYAFRNADRLLTVDPFLQKEVIRLAKYDGSNILNVPTGYDENEWVPGENKEDMVLTVAACDDKWRFRKKGIDKLFSAARTLPSVRFCLVGVHKSFLPGVIPMTPPNVELVPHALPGEVLRYYQKAKVYCQPSFTEGLPNSLCEAMLCGCIPVGTIAGGIPTAIGTAGYLVEYRDQPGLVRALQSALSAPVSDGLKARERIMREFPLQKRERLLREVIDGLCR
jgi:glycosyltransferase involved in cell wall biosynthesis